MYDQHMQYIGSCNEARAQPTHPDPCAEPDGEGSPSEEQGREDDSGSEASPRLYEAVGQREIRLESTASQPYQPREACSYTGSHRTLWPRMSSEAPSLAAEAAAIVCKGSQQCDEEMRCCS